jgi:hypothetical protein
MIRRDFVLVDGNVYCQNVQVLHLSCEDSFCVDIISLIGEEA